jgi:hypothetical protein
MTTPRREPYIWATWITKILAGEQNCQWQSWFKAHYSDFAKQQRSNDLVEWTAKHGEMVRRRADELRAKGYAVYVEDQNKFTLKGRVATLQGKPDIVAILNNEDRSGSGPHPPYDALVVDCKSGKQRDSDRFQVLIYMMMLPLTHLGCKGKILRGELEYQDDRVAIDFLSTEVKDMIRTTIESVAGETELPIVPSYQECRFCELTKLDCKERIESRGESVTATDLW